MPKYGRTLQELVAEVDRQNGTKKDYLVQSQALAVASHNYRLVDGERQPEIQSLMVLPQLGVQAPMNDTSHDQLSTHLGIPLTYYRRLRTEQPELLDRNINTLLRAAPEEEVRMVRTLDGNARAFLSNRYRTLDNYDLLAQVLPIIKEAGDIQVASCEITESKLYLKFTTPRIVGDVLGQVVQAGFQGSNSEIGRGGLDFMPYTFKLDCLNGMVHQQNATRRRHVGRIATGSGDDEAYEVYSDDTLRADDVAFWLKVRDQIRSILGEATFKHLLNKMREAAGAPIPHQPVKIIEVVARKYNLTQGESEIALQSLIDGQRYDLFSLAQAITFTAQKVESYDRSDELDRLGGQIIEMSKDDYRDITTFAGQDPAALLQLQAAIAL